MDPFIQYIRRSSSGQPVDDSLVNSVFSAPVPQTIPAATSAAPSGNSFAPDEKSLREVALSVDPTLQGYRDRKSKLDDFILTTAMQYPQYASQIQQLGDVAFKKSFSKKEQEDFDALEQAHAAKQKAIFGQLNSYDTQNIYSSLPESFQKDLFAQDYADNQKKQSQVAAKGYDDLVKREIEMADKGAGKGFVMGTDDKGNNVPLNESKLATDSTLKSYRKNYEDAIKKKYQTQLGLQTVDPVQLYYQSQGLFNPSYQ